MIKAIYSVLCSDEYKLDEYKGGGACKIFLVAARIHIFETAICERKFFKWRQYYRSIGFLIEELRLHKNGPHN